MRTASFDTTEAFADAKHQEALIPDASLRRKLGFVRVETLKNAPIRADARP